MASYNHITLMGRVGAAPVVRSFEDKKVAQFSIATDYGYGEKKETDWHNIVAWSPRAEFIENYVGSGDMVIVSGTLRYRSYKNDKGEERKITEILATTVELVRKSEKSAPVGAPQSSRMAAPVNKAVASTSTKVENYQEEKGDLPF